MNPIKPECGHDFIVEGCSLCMDLRRAWAEELEKSGFKDAEDIETGMLWTWTGHVPMEVKKDGEYVNIIDFDVSQAFEEPLTSSFPHTIFSVEDDLLHSSELDEIIQGIMGRGNGIRTISVEQAKEVWKGYTEGRTVRAIAADIGTHYWTVFRTIKIIESRMNLMFGDNQDIDQKPLEVMLRDYQPGNDEAFLYSSWRNSLWYDDPEREKESGEAFYRAVTRHIKAFLKNKDVVTKVACEKAQPRFILGYSVQDKKDLVWVYVKSDYRKQGIASMLTKGLTLGKYPASTKVARAIAAAKGIKVESKNEQD